MQLTRIYTGVDRHSHFATEEIPMQDRGPSGMFSAAIDDRTVIFRESPGSFTYDWHTVERRK